MANLAQLRDRVDAWLADKWPTVVARQQNFFTNRGRYWQGLRTHTIIPAHTNGSDGDSAPDRMDDNLTDQYENWRAVFPEWDGVPIPCALQVDVYDGPQGKGWVARIFVTFNGATYTRAQNVGPHSWLTQGWLDVDAE